MRIHLCQCRPTLGDVENNLAKVQAEVEAADADIIVFPELFLVGYPAFDAVFDNGAEARIHAAIDALVKDSLHHDMLLIVGTPYFDGKHWKNSALAIAGGKIQHRHDKVCLPNNDVFYDSRYFVAGNSVDSFDWQGQQLAMLICEDVWFDQSPSSYQHNPVDYLSQQRLDLIVHITASPYELGKFKKRLHQLKTIATKHQVKIISVNMVGAYAELIFDGQSFVMNSSGEIIARAPAFQEVALPMSMMPLTEFDNDMDELTEAICFGLREYMARAGFEKVVIGMSGGIDSALVAALAVKAIGANSVSLVSMPTKFNSIETKTDAAEMAAAMGCEFFEIPIETLRESYDIVLSTTNSDKLLGLTKQNVQARIRGTILMGLANQTGALLLTTGNKSELAMGYATLYGDMCGGLNIIGDLFKTQVVELSTHLHNQSNAIPMSIIERPPSAELEFNQTDQDSLPAYPVLDSILTEIMINNQPLNSVLEMNDNNTVKFIINQLKKNEFKRFQSPPILKVSSRSFGRGWLYPLIT